MYAVYSTGVVIKFLVKCTCVVHMELTFIRLVGDAECGVALCLLSLFLPFDTGW